jgi:hypothetical protein
LNDTAPRACRPRQNALVRAGAAGKTVDELWLRRRRCGAARANLHHSMATACAGRAAFSAARSHRRRWTGAVGMTAGIRPSRRYPVRTWLRGQSRDALRPPVHIATSPWQSRSRQWLDDPVRRQMYRSQMLQPLAIAAIGGILISMVLSLVTAPAAHYLRTRERRALSATHF